MRRLRYLVEVLRVTGMRHTAAAIRRRMWDTQIHLGLRCELAELGSAPAAQVAVEMLERDVAAFRGFHTELARASGSDAHEVLWRISFCQAGVESLYVAELDGQPVYCQWLVRPGQQAVIDRHAPDTFSPLHPGEVLLEGAYTFTAFRGKRAMAAGMAQLLQIARTGGSTVAITYVGADNVPSLKGCARVGFGLDHQRITSVRLGRRRTESRPPDDRARAAWALATG